MPGDVEAVAVSACTTCLGARRIRYRLTFDCCINEQDGQCKANVAAVAVACDVAGAYGVVVVQYVDVGNVGFGEGGVSSCELKINRVTFRKQQNETCMEKSNKKRKKNH